MCETIGRNPLLALRPLLPTNRCQLPVTRSRTFTRLLGSPPLSSSILIASLHGGPKSLSLRLSGEDTDSYLIVAFSLVEKSSHDLKLCSGGNFPVRFSMAMLFKMSLLLFFPCYHRLCFLQDSKTKSAMQEVLGACSWNTHL